MWFQVDKMFIVSVLLFTQKLQFSTEIVSIEYMIKRPYMWYGQPTNKLNAYNYTQIEYIQTIKCVPFAVGGVNIAQWSRCLFTII